MTREVRIRKIFEGAIQRLALGSERERVALYAARRLSVIAAELVKEEHDAVKRAMSKKLEKV